MKKLIWTQNRVMGIVIILMTLISCKSTKTIAGGELNPNMTARQLIKAHYQSETNFTTLSGKLKIDYASGDDAQGFTVSFRMKKDEVIWISAPFGVVKAYISPDRVSFYNRLQGEYFDGDFSYLSQLLGTELDFEKLQNVLLGNALFDLRERKYELQAGTKYYGLKPKQGFDLFKVWLLLNPENFKMASQQLSQPRENNLLKIDYREYQRLGTRTIPKTVAIDAVRGDKSSIIGLQYRNMEFDREIRFPYKIPSGLKKIVLREDEL
ncbi:MAG: DUF4292 domain-containing protein [Flavobacteriaceae bacterium]